jgi:hypothetical protein
MNDGFIGIGGAMDLFLNRLIPIPVLIPVISIKAVLCMPPGKRYGSRFRRIYWADHDKISLILRNEPDIQP